MEAVRDFTFLDSKITAGSDHTHENESSLLLERKALTNLDRVLKSRDITLSAKGHIIKALVFHSFPRSRSFYQGCAQETSFGCQQSWRMQTISKWLLSLLCLILWMSGRKDMLWLRKCSLHTKEPELKQTRVPQCSSQHSL